MFPCYLNDLPNHDLSGHPNTINWEYYTTEVVVNDFGDQYSLWEGRVNVMNNTDGISYAYDITKLQEMSVNPFGVKLPTSPANDNVPQNKSNSNTKNSLTVDSKGNEISEGQREYCQHYTVFYIKWEEFIGKRVFF